MGAAALVLVELGASVVELDVETGVLDEVDEGVVLVLDGVVEVEVDVGVVLVLDDVLVGVVDVNEDCRKEARRDRVSL